MEELSAVRQAAIAALASAGVPSPGADADLLLCHVLGISRSELKLRELRGDVFQGDQREQFTALVAARRTRIPLQHLTGVAHFRYLELKVGPGVFTPRPETETVVQLGLDFVAAHRIDAPSCIDLCSGSGAIAAALASELPGSRVWAVELSAEAIGYTRANCLPHQVTVLHQDATSLPGEFDASMDLVISNPPYIPPNAIPREAEVRDHDPDMALYGLGEDGLQIPRAISAQAMKLLRPGGYFVMEHAEVQQDSAAAMLREAGFERVAGHKDLTGRARATSGYAPHREAVPPTTHRA
ncbi:peptide chain release factor N(5)-glutamine methyltransferase [Glutamicibacter halophytocola]|uniref:Release factor glutamine methyltransferase n=1 Tax=Glutamicibacter halophytocola TaxID=1933880 RepID=A0A5B8IIE3_9MICC|nr:peptide chain release factor N(5)-glutamine methyltransferase [Glutamicibacter halophytocola]QDY64933.1 peptide chain release factor N(5)-glutamine methyltransferase [Glutamicibacter halophytocola]UUX60237.1 peptide chain release factor N(5)-glutamine methyltransferase [Glutamicibacter halophytocola]